MFGLAAIAKPLFSIVLGTKWLPSVIMFQALCFAYAITPMQILNQNIMKIKGRSDLFLRTEIIKYVAFTPLLILGAFYGITVLIAGVVLFYWTGYLINTVYSKLLIGYSILEQSLDFLPVMGIALVPAIITWSMERILLSSNIILLAVQVILYPSLVVILSLSFKVPAFFEIMRILKDKFTMTNFIKTIGRDE
jgi:O-antigen/teichoic acid export membrane protein